MNALQTRKAGVAGALAGLVVLIAGAAGLDVPPAVAAAFILIAAVVASAINPRFENLRGEILAAHPAGLTAAVTTFAVWILGLAGVNMSADEIAVIVAGLTAVVSIATPAEPR